MNRHAKITKFLLDESLLRFLEFKHISKITVKEICEEADLNRSTYYQYYENPYDQVMKLEAAAIERMTACIDTGQIRLGQLRAYDDMYPVVKKTTDYIQKNKRLFLSLLSSHSGVNLPNDMQTVYMRKLRPADFQPSRESMELEQEFIFGTSGTFALIYHWLQTDTSESAEELSKRITSFITRVLA